MARSRLCRSPGPWAAALAWLLIVQLDARAAPARPDAADAAAAQEELLARPQTDFLAELRTREMARLIDDDERPADAHLAALLQADGSKQPALGDVTVPLHLRLVELARRDLVSGVEAARQAVPTGEACNVRNAFGRALYEPQGRAQALAMVYCTRAAGERARRAIHEANALHVARIGELRLPPYTRELWQGTARAAAAAEDERLRRKYEHLRVIDDALEKWILFLDAHAHAFHVENGNLVFDSDADASDARVQQEQLAKLLDEPAG